jgi:hypothetical protein
MQDRIYKTEEFWRRQDFPWDSDANSLVMELQKCLKRAKQRGFKDIRLVFTQDEGRFGCYLSGSRKETEKEQVARLAADQAEQKWREAAAKRDILDRIRRAATSLPEGDEQKA